MSSNEHATPPYESLHSTAEPASPSLQSHRNLHHSISTHSPRRRHPPSSRSSPAPPSFHAFDNPNMDFPQTTIATATGSNTAQSDPRTAWRGANPPTMSDGQDHDRMETDDDDHDSAFEEDNMSAHHPESDPAVSSYTLQNPSGPDEAMDTTPDDPHDEGDSGDHLLGNVHSSHWRCRLTVDEFPYQVQIARLRLPRMKTKVLQTPQPSINRSHRTLTQVRKALQAVVG